MLWSDSGINSRENYELVVSILNYRLLKMGFGYGVSLKAYYRLADDEDFMKLAIHLCEHPRSQQATKALRSSIDEMQDAVEYEMVFVDRETGVELRPPELGMGVSQMVPIIVGALVPSRSIMSVQQPELHLHPALQCDLGDYLLCACEISPKTMMIETHSEHLILRLLRRIRETSRGQIPNENCQVQLRPDDLAVLYVDQALDGMRVSRLRVDENGEFIDEWPEGFFEEGFNEIVGGL
jgi:predicted ATPase